MQRYATFWQRLAAMWIDLLVFLPLTTVQLVLESSSKRAAIALVVPMAASVVAYDVFCHARFGQTIGKRIMSIHVVRTTGERIGWREAILRSSVHAGLLVCGVFASFSALSAIRDIDYYVPWYQRYQNLLQYHPRSLAWADIATTVWFWSEAFTALLNGQRRALHDFIGGTIVTAERRAVVSEHEIKRPSSSLPRIAPLT